MTTSYYDKELLKKYSRTALDLTAELIHRFPGRLAGSESCLRTAEILEKELGKNCDSTSRESFTFHRDAFLGFLTVLAATYVSAVIFLFFGGKWVFLSALSLTLGLIWTVVQFVFYRENFDVFYPKYRGTNIIGTIEPTGEVKQQIIIGAHHDAAKVFTFLASEWQKYYALRIGAAAFFLLGTLLFSWIWGFYALFTGSDPGFAQFLKYAVLVGLVFVTPFFFFVGKRVSPGAGDNLISSALTVQLADLFGNNGPQHGMRLENTRLILLSTDAEESGLRGARAYVKRHITDLQAVPTFFFNLESIYNIDQIQFLTSDLNGFQPLSEEMARECMTIAHELGYQAKLFPFTFGGGGTDAAEFAAQGLEATTFIAMPTNLFRDKLTYHTHEDTVDHIEPEAVEAALHIACEYILRKDKNSV